MRQYDPIIKAVLLLIFISVAIVIGIYGLIKNEYALSIGMLAIILWFLFPTIIIGITSAWKKRRKKI